MLAALIWQFSTSFEAASSQPPAHNARCWVLLRWADGLSLRSQNPNSMGWVALDACLLIMFLVVIRFLTYVALRHKTAAK